MTTGDIVLIPVPFSDLKNAKVRPAVVICITKDKYKDAVVSAISSVLPKKLSENEIAVMPDRVNNLRTVSVIKVDRIVTAKSEFIIAKLGKLDKKELDEFRKRFRNLVK